MARRGAQVGEPQVDVRVAADGDGPALWQVVRRDGVSLDGDELQPFLGSGPIVRKRLSNNHLLGPGGTHTARLRNHAIERMAIGGRGCDRHASTV